MSQHRIEDYALLGNCRSAALVAADGAIDWLCFPRFDSPACLAALVGTPENGRWRIAPRGAVRERSRAYIDGTLVLETTHVTPTGTARVTDFMPYDLAENAVVRIVTGIDGTVDFEMDLTVRFDYGSSLPWIEQRAAGLTTAVAGPDLLALRAPLPVAVIDGRMQAAFTVEAGRQLVFSLTHQASNAPLADGLDAQAALAATLYFWQAFSSRCPPAGPYSAQVKRSLITLKALTYQPTGAIVAAATTSLPEQIGGQRNWDYRYCWLRDATMTLLAFMSLGYYDEASAWYQWLLRAIAGSPAQMQIMYGLDGERRLPEAELGWLCGYEDSRPVRIGNAAAMQFQLDVYGEVAHAIAQARRGGLPHHPRSDDLANVMLPYLERVWREPDEGIWEIRGERRHFIHSKVLAWVAFERMAEHAASQPGREAFARRCTEVAAEIHAEVCARGFDAHCNSFVQSYGSRAVDANLLQIVLTGFLPPDDPRVIGTVAAIEQRLMCDGLLRRYDTGAGVDGLPPGEGAFLVCSFWLADAYVLMGRRQDAAALYERLLGLCNDVGLLSEQYDPRAGRMLGNFPQAFSHIGIINTALNLARAGGGDGKQANG